jgi:hypothetical protein
VTNEGKVMEYKGTDYIRDTFYRNKIIVDFNQDLTKFDPESLKQRDENGT